MKDESNQMSYKCYLILGISLVRIEKMSRCSLLFSLRFISTPRNRPWKKFETIKIARSHNKNIIKYELFISGNLVFFYKRVFLVLPIENADAWKQLCGFFD